uniref:hypothetical protein n=1 Tax=Nonomuraea bangladeshensis TaxID=404385 RepID=UPI003F4999C0
MAALVAIVLLPFVADALPWGDGVNRVLPTFPAFQLIEQYPDVMPAWAAVTVLGAWAVGLLAVVIVARRV